MINDVKLGVIIISYNRGNALQRLINCLSLQNCSFTYQVAIVDNASDELTKNIIKQLPENVTKIFNTKNLGWATAVNQGLKFHKKNNCDYFLICNDDIWFDNNNLFQYIINNLQIEQNQHIGIAGVEIISQYGKQKFHIYGRDIFGEYFSQKIGFNIAKSFFQNQDNKLKYCDFTDGCFLIIKSEVNEKIGFMDENFFMYWEEADFCLRAWNKGFACAIFPDLSIYHSPEINFIDNSFTLYWKSRNFIIFLKKNKFWQFSTFWRSIYYQLVKTIKIITKKKNYKGNIIALWYFLWKGTIRGIMKKVKR